MDKLKITFGIITTAETQSYIENTIRSIEDEIPKDMYEIIIVGNCGIQSNDNIRVLPFDESQKHMWITKKKNLISIEAKYENIVYMHDYLYLGKNWYRNFLDFGTDWDICMNSIKNLDGSRLLDWVGMPDDTMYGNVNFPYDYRGSGGMYVPGYFWISKKSVMLEYPLDESFSWGEGEDIEWSKRVIGGFIPRWLKNREYLESGNAKMGNLRYSMNPYCEIISSKYKKFPNSLFSEWDMHSGNEARPLPSLPENYEYLKYRNNR